ncbi:MAG: ascorbate-dependent monooxygenase [Chthoniobacteraceae bacterium]
MNTKRFAPIRPLLITSLVVFASARASAEAPPTFTKDIAPILFQNCASCHRPGEVGPFSLLTYQDARKRAKQLATITGQRIMPPWKPVAGHEEFKDARVLDDEKSATIRAWYEAGAPEGDAKDLPPQPKFPEGWHAGPPDMILKVPKPFNVPAEGPDIYVHFVLPMNLDKDKYVKAVQILPSNRRIAHHGVIMLDGSGTARKLAAKHEGDHYPNFGGPGFIPRGFLPGYAPGMTTRVDRSTEASDDMSITLGKGLDVVLQMHYHPIGKEGTDQPQIGLYFTDKPPKRGPAIIGMANNDVDIPAGAIAHKRADSFKVPVDFEVQTIWGHMHMIGKEVKVWAELPDGKTKDMLLISDWDFNWQDTYSYKKPFVLPKGTVVNAEWMWDNTAGNPRNPNSPPKRVTFGEGSTDEMTGLLIGGKTVNAGLEEGVMWLTVIRHYLDVERKAKEAEAKRTSGESAAR